MTLQDYDLEADTPTTKRRNGPIAMVALVLALIGLGGWLIIDSQQSTQPVEVTSVSNPGCTVDAFNNYTCPVVMSDPRVSGIETFQLGEMVMTEEGEYTVASWTNPITLTNDGGSWTGVQVGTSRWSSAEPAHMHVVDVEFTGTGAYEGLIYHYHNEFSDFDDAAVTDVVITGTIEQAD